MSCGHAVEVASHKRSSPIASKRYSAELFRWPDRFVRLPRLMRAATGMIASGGVLPCSYEPPDVVRFRVTRVMSSSCSQSFPTNTLSSARHSSMSCLPPLLFSTNFWSRAKPNISPLGSCASTRPSGLDHLRAWRISSVMARSVPQIAARAGLGPPIELGSRQRG